MDDGTRYTLEAYINAFDGFNVEDPVLRGEIEQWKADATALAYKCGDAMTFSKELMEGPLYGAMTNLMTKASGYTPPTEDQLMPGKEDETFDDIKVVSVKEFVDQYRAAYEPVKEAGYRRRGQKAYENLFAVADRTDDMIEAQIIMEREGMFLALTTQDSLDIFQTIYEAMDPLYDVNVAMVRKFTEYNQRAKSPQELSYMADMGEYQIMETVNKGQSIMMVTAMLHEAMMYYQRGKYSLRQWDNERAAQEGFGTMFHSRNRIRRIYTMMVEDIGMTWDDIMGDEFSKICMLSHEGLDQFWRYKSAPPPEHLEALREILFDEVLTDMTIMDILAREQKTVARASLKDKKDQVDDKYQAIVNEENSKLPYYWYMENLNPQQRAGFQGETNKVLGREDANKPQRTREPVTEGGSFIKGLGKLFGR